MTVERLRIILETKAEGDGSQKANKGLEAIGKAAKFAAGAFATIKSAEAVVEVAKVGAESRRQRGALENLAEAAGTTGDAIVNAMQEASDLTIDRSNAMAAANRALVMEVAKTPEEFGRMTKVATALSRAMGEDVTKGMDDFMTAAARQSVMIADNLGLTISLSRANENYARKLGVTSASLTDAQKKQAFLNEMLAQGEEKMLALGDSLDEMAKIEMITAAVEDAKTGFAELFVEIVGGVEGVKELSKRMRDLPQTFRQVATFVGAGAKALGGYLKTGDEFVPMAVRMERAQYAFSNAMLKGAGLLDDYRRGTEELQYARLAGLPTYQQEQANLETLNALRDASATGLTRYWDAQNRVHESVGASTDSLTQYQAAIAAQEAASLSAVASANAMAEAQAAANDAIQYGIKSNLELAQSLKGASEVEIVAAATKQLGGALAEGDITIDQYNTAVGEMNSAFGFMDEATLNLATRMTALTTGVADGTLAAEDYSDSLEVVIQMHETEKGQLEKFGELLSTATTKTGEQTSSLGDLAGQAGTTTGKVNDLGGALDALPSNIDIKINYKVSSPPSLPSDVPTYAQGTSFAPGGWAVVGEKGAELVHLPRGSQVFSNSASASMAGRGAVTVNVYNTIIDPNPERLVRDIEEHLQLVNRALPPIGA